MSNYRINRNYAKALLMMAEERGQSDRVAADMRLVSAVCGENRELGVVFADPVGVTYVQKDGIVKALFEGHVCDETLAFLRFVVRKSRSVHLRGISEALC